MGFLAALREKAEEVAYQKLMREFLEGIAQGVRGEYLDTGKQNWKYHCFEEILLEFGDFVKPQQAQCVGYPDYCFYYATPKNPLIYLALSGLPQLFNEIADSVLVTLGNHSRRLRSLSRSLSSIH